MRQKALESLNLQLKKPENAAIACGFLCNVIPPLLVNLHDPDSTVRIDATRALNTLATTATGKLKLISEDALPRLLDLVTDPDSDVRRQACIAMISVSSSPVGANGAVDAKVIQVYNKHILQEIPEHQVLMLLALHGAVKTPAGFTVALEDGLQSTLKIMLQKSVHGEVLNSACDVLLALATLKAGKEQAIGIDLVAVLTRLVEAEVSRLEESSDRNSVSVSTAAPTLINASVAEGEDDSIPGITKIEGLEESDLVSPLANACACLAHLFVEISGKKSGKKEESAAALLRALQFTADPLVLMHGLKALTLVLEEADVRLATRRMGAADILWELQTKLDNEVLKKYAAAARNVVYWDP